MRFEEALKAMREGKTVGYKCGEISIHFYIKDEDIISECFCGDEKECDSEASHWFMPEEILSEEWEIVNDNT